MSEIVIVAAKRTAIGSLNGALTPKSAHELGAAVASAVLSQSGIAPDQVDEVIMGQVLTAAAGMNPARQAARAAGIHDDAPAMTINQVCGSGLRAIALGMQQIQTGQADIVLAGGQESMSNAPHAAVLRQGKKLGAMEFQDTMMHDGLTDAFFGYPMGNTAENVARRYNLTRDAQDAFAVQSQLKASKAQQTGAFVDEIVPVTIAARRGEVTVCDDEYIRHDVNLADMAKLRPAFVADGTVTAANSSGINDGAAAVLVMTATRAEKLGLEPLARIVSWAHAGLAPDVMGLGPIPASRQALERASWSVADVDVWELNEAFAAQALAVMRDLGMDPQRVNPNGGAIALGHPIGASGARVLVTLLHQMSRTKAQRGLASLCIGGGMGIAMCVERV